MYFTKTTTNSKIQKINVSFSTISYLSTCWSPIHLTLDIIDFLRHVVLTNKYDYV